MSWRLSSNTIEEAQIKTTREDGMFWLLAFYEFFNISVFQILILFLNSR